MYSRNRDAPRSWQYPKWSWQYPQLPSWNTLTNAFWAGQTAIVQTMKESSQQIKTASHTFYHDPDWVAWRKKWTSWGGKVSWHYFDGATAPLSFVHFRKAFSRQKTRFVVTKFMRSSLWYYGMNMLCEELCALCASVVPGAANSYPGYGVYTLTRLQLANWYATQLVEQIFYLRSLVVAGLQEEDTDPYKKICAHDEGPKTKAGIESVVYFVGNSAVVYAAEAIPAYALGSPAIGWVVALPLKTLLWGQTLLEYRVGANSCMVDCYNIINANNAYSLGLGTTFLLTKYGLTLVTKYSVSFVTEFFLPVAVQKYLCEDGFFLEASIMSMVYAAFVFAACTTEKPLPGDGSGRDIFYYSRLVWSHVFKDSTEALAGLFAGEGSMDVLGTVKAIHRFPLINLAGRWLLPEEERSLQKVLARRPIHVFLEININTIESKIDDLVKKHFSSTYRTIDAVSYYLPEALASADTKKLLSMVVDRRLDKVIEWLQDFVEKVADMHKNRGKVWEARENIAKFKQTVLLSQSQSAIFSAQNALPAPPPTSTNQESRPQVLFSASSSGLFAGGEADGASTPRSSEATIVHRQSYRKSITDD